MARGHRLCGRRRGAEIGVNYRCGALGTDRNVRGMAECGPVRPSTGLTLTRRVMEDALSRPIPSLLITGYGGSRAVA